MKNVHSLILSLSLALPMTSFATEPGSGVSEMDFNTGVETPVSRPDPSAGGGNAYQAPVSPVNPALPPLNSSRPSNYASLSCENKCAVINGSFDLEALDSACNKNEQCRQCVTSTHSVSMNGDYCSAVENYDKAKSLNRRSMALYGAGLLTCGLACTLGKTPFTAWMEGVCKVSSIATAVAEMQAMGKLSSVDEDLRGWAKTAKSVSSTGTKIVAGILSVDIAKTIMKEATKTSVKELAKMSSSMSCVSAGLMGLALASKSSNMSQNSRNRDKVCQAIDSINDPRGNQLKTCRDSAGLASGVRNSFLSYIRPKPFVIPVPDTVAAVTGDGLIGETYSKDPKALEEMYNALSPDIRSRLDQGENALNIAKDMGLFDKATATGLEGISEKLANGEKMALFAPAGDSSAQTAGSSKTGKSGAGSGEPGFSFDASGDIARTDEGASTDEQSYGKSLEGRSAAGAGQSCGEGFAHKGCNRSIFRIVSEQLERKSKSKAVAQLPPDSKLNRMLAGVKVKTDSRKPGDRAPASAVK